jgi:hypothetical protein
LISIVCDLHTHSVRTEDAQGLCFFRDRAHLARRAAKSNSLPAGRKHKEKRKARKMRAVPEGDDLAPCRFSNGARRIKCAGRFYSGGGFAIRYGRP